MKTEVDKLDINKLVNILTGLYNLKTILGDLDVGKLKNVPTDLKKLSLVVYNEFIKNTKFKALTTKVNKVGQKISGLTFFNSH